MMGSQSSSVEILVHIAAPSRFSDDKIYRRLAQSYLDFESASRDRITSSFEGEESPVPGSDKTTLPTVSSSGHILCRDSQDLSFQGAFGNNASPILRAPIVSSPERWRTPSYEQDSNGKGRGKSWETPPSEIADSYPMPDLGIIRATPTRLLHQFLSSRGISISSPTSTSLSSHDRGAVPAESPLQTLYGGDLSARNNVVDLTTTLSSGIIPVTPAIRSGLGACPRHRPVDELNDVVFDTTRISSSTNSNPSSAATDRAGSEPPPSKRTRRDDVVANTRLHVVRSASDASPACPSVPPSVVGDITSLALLEIRPPSPPISTNYLEPVHLVSEKLAKLAHDLSSRYKPLAHRDLDPLERGYWLINCSTWNEQTQLETWIFLANYVKSGLAGWGVWCSRDQSAQWIRLYCWGHIVPHTYLLLYLASGRQVKATGAEWYDAAGERTVHVDSYDKGN